MKKVGLICIVLLLALGTIGVSYAKWSADLVIDGTMVTATPPTPEVVFLDAKSNDPASTDDPDDEGNWTFPDPADPSTWAWIGSRRNQDKAITLGSPGSSTLIITMITDSEAPNYDYYPAVAVLVTNTGTAAAYVTVEVTKPPEVLVIEQGGILDGYSLDPGESMTGYINMEVPRTFPNNTTYTVTLDLEIS